MANNNITFCDSTDGKNQWYWLRDNDGNIAKFDESVVEDEAKNLRTDPNIIATKIHDA